MKILFVIILFACMATRVNAGIYVKDHLWPKNSLVTCFAPEEDMPRITKYGDKLKIGRWKSIHKEMITIWINEAYTPQRTGIHFVGWKDCTETVDADVIIFSFKNSFSSFFSDSEGTANTFGYYPGEIEGYPSAGNFVAIRNFTKGVVLHEFGHVVGLLHEHNHPEAKGRCGYNLPFEKVPENVAITDFDPESIMSYCNVGQSGLSNAESELLKTLY